MFYVNIWMDVYDEFLWGFLVLSGRGGMYCSRFMVSIGAEYNGELFLVILEGFR
jgi:hypothetical protein